VRFALIDLSVLCFACSPWQKKTTELKLEHFGDGPFLDVVPRCQFYKLPHKVEINLCSLFVVQ